MSELYDNLLKATNNIDDITTEKYATITKLNGNYCNTKEEDTGLEHKNVPIINGANLSVGDKVILGFLNNSIYDVVCYGALDKTIHDDSKQDLLVSGTNIKTINNESILGSGNITIQGGGSSVNIVTSWSSTTSDSKVPSEKLTKNSLDDKISKSQTSGLVKNDGTVDTTSYSTFSGSYNDLSNKPSIPSASSDLSDGSDLVKKSSTSGLLKNDGSVDTNAYITSSAITGKEDASNKVTSWSSTVNDTHYPSEKLVSDSLATKQATLVSGTNIKTINNQSLLGSGNISVSGGGGLTFDDVYPVGSIYMSANDVDPSTLFGGTWQRIEDKFLLASGTSYSNGATGGSATVSLTQSQMPRHNHSTNAHSHTTSDNGEYFVTNTQSNANNTRVAYNSSGNRMVDGFNTTSSIFHHRANTNSQSPSTKYTGGTGSTEAYSDGSAHENMPPYLVVNVWKRTA